MEHARTLETNVRTPRSWMDRVGMVASTACAAHCVICALAPSLLAVLGLGTLIGHEAEWIFTGIAAVFAVGALMAGLRSHGSRMPAVVLAVGVVALILARLSEEWHVEGVGVALSVGAGVMLVVGHLANIRASRHCCDAAQPNEGG